MEYIKVKNADKMVSSCPYVVKNPERYKNKWSDYFGNKNPISLELGTGRGEFILKMAQKFPNRNFIGLEISDSQLSTATEKLKQLSLPNLKLINADAKDIDKFFGKEIDTIYLTFSEPWPKRIDEKSRFTHESFLKLYDKIFKKHKHIIMKTDNKGLFAYSLETLSQYWYTFNKVSLDLHNDERSIDNVMTDFEKHYYEEGRPIYYVDAIFND